jgi:hypothetical protein
MLVRNGLRAFRLISGPEIQFDCCQVALVAHGGSGDATALRQHNAKGPHPTPVGRGLSLVAGQCRRAILAAGQARPGMPAVAGHARRQSAPNSRARQRDNQDHGPGRLHGSTFPAFDLGHHSWRFSSPMRSSAPRSPTAALPGGTTAGACYAVQTEERSA